MLYLFIGEDYFSKDIQLEKIKRSCFLKNLEPFNYDVFFAPDLQIEKLQESLKRLPQKAKKRVILIRQTELLKKEIKDYLCSYIKKPYPQVSLILDFREFDSQEKFNRIILRYAKVFHFRSKEILNTFRLSQEIERRRIVSALRILHTLLREGIEPEMLLGGLRYCWQTGYLSREEKKRRLTLLLDTDLSIKTGRL
ncbi:MAG: hypothetical protein NC909_00290, partial [Candidatus Omnitrophica bacterium]|nr:hypothetical protein [Candidatus Omnitrophota bacterium]